MNDAVIVAIISLIGTLGGTFGGILTSGKLTSYRLEQLEKKVEKMSSVSERTFELELREENHRELIKNLRNRIDRIESLSITNYN